MSFSLQTLTEGIRDRHVGQQNKRLVEKWSRTGLLRGMDDVNREVMATLLENQAAQVLRESNTMGSDSVGGFTNIAFPIVRRVFGGLVANELVSIQPMSLPSGLLFYLDYTYGNSAGGYGKGQSIYGQPSGKDIQNGADAVGGQYDLAGSGFSRRHALATTATQTTALIGPNGQKDILDELVNTDLAIINTGRGAPNSDVPVALGATQQAQSLRTDKQEDLKLIQHDPQIIDRINDLGEKFAILLVHPSLGDADQLVSFKNSVDGSMIKDFALVAAVGGNADDLDLQNVLRVPAKAIQSTSHTFLAEGTTGAGVVAKGTVFNIRRLNQLGTWSDATGTFTANSQASLSAADTRVLMIVQKKDSTIDLNDANLSDFNLSHVVSDGVTVGAGGEADGTPSFEADFAGPDGTPTIPEIDIKIESIPVTAQTRKLRARWSPELAQDLNAYHSMDAEVELTQILSEQIALEIDREILGDLLNGAKGANFFWSRSPGKFVNKRTGGEIARTSTLNPGPAFTGTVREWYETLTETVIDVANEIHRKTLRGSANFIVVSPDVATILEASVLYRPSYSLDGDGQVGAPFTMGAEKIGSLSNRFTVYKDPYFPRNKILVGYKGGSYLETGFVYAPYVPLIVTPTIFQPEDFTPRKGVMTRYGKKMVRADFYGTVTCLDMNII
jgi:hypothetical protein